MAGLDAEEAPLERLRAEEEEEIGGEVRGIADIGESFEGTNIDERLISIGMELVAKIHQDEHDDIPFSCFWHVFSCFKQQWRKIEDGKIL